jgi:hypothetical protein
MSRGLQLVPKAVIAFATELDSLLPYMPDIQPDQPYVASNGKKT